MSATAHILLASNMNSTITWSLKGFLHIFYPSPDSQTPLFSAVGFKSPPKRVQTARTAGFFGILVASLEFRGVRAETIRVRSAQTGGLDGMKPPTRWSQEAWTRWTAWTSGKFQPRCHGWFFLLLSWYVCFFGCVFPPPAYFLEDQDIYVRQGYK